MNKDSTEYFKREDYFSTIPKLFKDNISLFSFQEIFDDLNKILKHSNQPVYLDSHSTIKNSYIGKNCKFYENVMVRDSIICDNVTIGHSSEVVRSIVFPNVEISHFVFIGDSLIGYNVIFGASTILCNERLDKNDISIEHKRYKSSFNSKRIGSIIGDHVSLGSNVTCMPGTMIGRGTHVSPCLIIKGLIKKNLFLKNKNINDYIITQKRTSLE
jgi:NDP-sugar pyrophosphorylase family protein